MYFYISYQWLNYDGKPVVSHMVWDLGIDKWLLFAVDQKEHWTMLDHVQIDSSTYNALKGKL